MLCPAANANNGVEKREGRRVAAPMPVARVEQQDVPNRFRAF
jgi:hypothetical protein